MLIQEQVKHKAAARSKKTGGGTDTAYEQMMKARGNDMQKQGPPETPKF